MVVGSTREPRSSFSFPPPLKKAKVAMEVEPEVGSVMNPPAPAPAPTPAPTPTPSESQAILATVVVEERHHTDAEMQRSVAAYYREVKRRNDAEALAKSVCV